MATQERRRTNHGAPPPRAGGSRVVVPRSSRAPVRDHRGPLRYRRSPVSAPESRVNAASTDGCRAGERGRPAASCRMHRSVRERLDRLAPDQRDAATTPPGPVLCVAPAGSGKTTTLVARVAWLIDAGAGPSTDRGHHLQRRAAMSFAERVARAPGPWRGARARCPDPDVPRARARDPALRLAWTCRSSTGRRCSPSVAPDLWPGGGGRLDTGDLAAQARPAGRRAAVANDPHAGPDRRRLRGVRARGRGTGRLDFDDLVAGGARSPRGLPPPSWLDGAACAELLVDEAQDLDRSELRISLLLAAPANRIFLVGDDDESIYGWRLADVRRVLGLTTLPGLARVHLVANHRCRPPVIDRAVRLIEVNGERFARRIRAASAARGGSSSRPTAADEYRRIGGVPAAAG